MADALVDIVSKRTTKTVVAALAQIRRQVTTNPKQVLVRRLKAAYDNLEIEDIQAIQAMSGHVDGEEKPCDVCKVMADMEFKLRDEGK